MAAQSYQGPLSNRTCQVCLTNDATHFCDCEGQPTLFCIVCVGTHSGKDLRTVHKAIPVAALGTNLEEYRRRSHALKETVAALRRNLDLVDQCCQEFNQMVQASIDYFTTFRSRWLSKMQTEREALTTVIEEAVVETTNCLDQGGEPVSLLGKALWTLHPDQLQVVHYSITFPDLKSLLQTCSSYHSDVQVLCEGFNPQGEEAKRSTAQKLAEVGNKYALSAEKISGWVKLMNALKYADRLKPLLEKIINLPQVATQVVVGLVEATLELCTRRPETVGEFSRGLEVLLDKPEAASQI